MESKGWNNGLESEPVTTYVSEDTKEVWRRHAEELDMSLSRFVEAMVNAGRSLYEDTAPQGYEDVDVVSAQREIQALQRKLEAREDSPEAADCLHVYSRLTDEPSSVEYIADEVDADEPEVYEALQTLIEEGLVDYHAMSNGYTRSEDDGDGS